MNEGGTGPLLANKAMHDHFQLFGLSQSFALDVEALERAYRDIQSRVHPDRYARAGDAERRASMQWATRVNEAYRTLRNPVTRAKHLLELHGVDVAFETNTAMPADFLMEQMELREELSELRGQSDPLAATGVFIARVRRRVDELVARLGERFAADALDAAVALVRELQFLRKLQLEAENLEAELEDELL